MKADLILWTCPKCGRTEYQPPTVKAVSHRCPATRRITDLRRES